MQQGLITEPLVRLSGCWEEGKGNQQKSGLLGWGNVVAGLAGWWCTSSSPLVKLSCPSAHFLPVMTAVERRVGKWGRGEPLGVAQ